MAKAKRESTPSTETAVVGKSNIKVTTKKAKKPEKVEHTLTVVFDFERETKNTIRFAERVEEEAEAVIGTLYVQKANFGEGVIPEEISVEITYKA